MKHTNNTNSTNSTNPTKATQPTSAQEHHKTPQATSKTIQDPYGIIDETGLACSAQDCTGLIPALPESEDQIEMYEELFPYMARAEKDKT